MNRRSFAAVALGGLVLAAAAPAATYVVSGGDEAELLIPSGVRVESYANFGYRLEIENSTARISVSAEPLRSAQPFRLSSLPPAEGATAKLARTQPLAADEFAFLRQVARATPKITMPAPSTMHFYRCGDFADPKVYADAESFFADLARIYREEIADLAEAGCRYIQLDEVAVAMLCDPAIREKVVDNVTLENYPKYDSPIPATGTIELQHHGNPLEFRNIYIKEL